MASEGTVLPGLYPGETRVYQFQALLAGQPADLTGAAFAMAFSTRQSDPAPLWTCSTGDGSIVPGADGSQFLVTITPERFAALAPVTSLWWLATATSDGVEVALGTGWQPIGLGGVAQAPSSAAPAGYALVLLAVDPAGTGASALGIADVTPADLFILA